MPKFGRRGFHWASEEGWTYRTKMWLEGPPLMRDGRTRIWLERPPARRDGRSKIWPEGPRREGFGSGH